MRRHTYFLLLAPRSSPGFTLIELMISIAIIIILGAATFGVFSGSRNANDVTNAAKQMAAVLRQAQTQSVQDYQGAAWGVHFANPTGTAPFYALFSNAYATATTAAYYRLPSSLGITLVPSGLVGYWPLDEGSGGTARDYSGSVDIGTWHGSGAGTSGYYSAGAAGPWAGTFDGATNYVVIPSDDAHFGTGASGVFSYSFWIKSNSYSGSILSRRNPCNNDAYFNITASGNVINLSSYSNVSLSSCAYASGNVLTTNQWNHVVITRQWGVAGTTKLYVNGISQTFSLVGGSDSSPEPNYAGLKEYIGAQESISTCGGPVTNFFNGLIDDVRIYNRVLSAAEITQLYNESADVLFSPIIGSIPASTSVELYSLSQPSLSSTISVAPTGAVSF
jgi:prepilin-type N-terminal cleavage/methylation domain-containing protein